MWCRAADYDYGSTDEEWLYEVKAPASDNLPALRMMEVEGQGYTLFLHIRFLMMIRGIWYILYPTGEKKALRGEIKAVWEREFKLKSIHIVQVPKRKEQ